jgi:hypothetical protein
MVSFGHGILSIEACLTVDGDDKPDVGDLIDLFNRLTAFSSQEP